MTNESPVSDWFELSYANYLTIPRSILEAMPTHNCMGFTKLGTIHDKESRNDSK